ncbi:unnamed protein product [Nippostrongylus brasiliensis]|uniref:DUF4440 domain-containing protein n=1 Tax=Nippostrongylus brasiliensis TaxID=27835 RepID=A0A0N4YG75_NIPBR|nr:unnamed protein product [Nippostrongylus brasiliensis]
MTPEEAKAILTPFYDEMVKNMTDGKHEENMKFTHPDAVVVDKDHKLCHYGLEQIGRSNEKCCACECCICYCCEFHFDSTKGPQTTKEFHIWRKHDNKWKLYHLEYEIVEQK